jgi:hypothetical protein
VPGGGELAHVQSELGDDDLGGLGADAGDLVQTVQRPKRGLGGCAPTPVVAPSPLPVGPAPSDGACAAGMAPISSWIRTVSRSI